MDQKNDFRDHVSTLDNTGKRVWVYSRKPKGAFYNKRVIVSIVLLIFFFSAPLISINGEPLFLFDVIQRKFVLFGQVFYPQDFLIFGLATLTFLVFIVLFTITYGRVWCGWACPQTIFMEMVFRRIEYWIEGDGPKQKRLSKEAMTPNRVVRRVLKLIIFALISLIIGNYLLMYLVGKEHFVAMVKNGPMENFGSFVAVILLSGAVFFNFSWLREQACTLICPYGRLQGALLDSNSLIVAYDNKRGEPRAPYNINEDRLNSSKKGHCIECNSCVWACPTGIDIRNGTQLECVNCTACIDACNNVMDRVKMPRGLIRLASENEILTGQKFKFTPRMILYSTVLVGLLVLLSSLIFMRDDLDTTVLRVPGTLYYMREDGNIGNMYNLRIINNAKFDMLFELRLTSHEGSIEMAGKNKVVHSLEKFEGVFMVVLPPGEIHSNAENIKIGLYTDGQLVEILETSFVAP